MQTIDVLSKSTISVFYVLAVLMTGTGIGLNNAVGLIFVVVGGSVLVFRAGYLVGHALRGRQIRSDQRIADRGTCPGYEIIPVMEWSIKARCVLDNGHSGKCKYAE